VESGGRMIMNDE